MSRSTGDPWGVLGASLGRPFGGLGDWPKGALDTNCCEQATLQSQWFFPMNGYSWVLSLGWGVPNFLVDPKKPPNHFQPPPKDPPPHPTPATPRHTPPQRPWGGKMGAPSARRPPPVAPIFPPHGRCGGVCRGVVGVGCGGGSFGGGWGGFGGCLGSIWPCFGGVIFGHLGPFWAPTRGASKVWKPPASIYSSPTIGALESWLY